MADDNRNPHEPFEPLRNKELEAELLKPAAKPTTTTVDDMRHLLRAWEGKCVRAEDANDQLREQLRKCEVKCDGLREGLVAAESELAAIRGALVPNSTPLEWGPTSPTRLTWDEAKKWCAELGEGWRMPTLDELWAAFDHEVGKPIGDGWQSGYYWSSTTYQDGPQYAWVVYFYAGRVLAYYKTTFYYVRAVRGGSEVK